MGKLTDEMSRLADEIQTMDVARDNFIKGIQNAVKQEADETRQFITNFRNDMNDARGLLREENLSQKIVQIHFGQEVAANLGCEMFLSFRTLC